MITRDEIVNRLLDAEPTDEIVISVGDISNKTATITDVCFMKYKNKMFVNIPEGTLDYLR